MVGDVQFGGHVDERRVGRAVLDYVNTFLVRQVLYGVVYVVLDGFDKRFALFVQFSVLSEILPFEFQHFLFLFYDLLFALGAHGFGEEYLLRLVVGRHDACFLLRGVNLFLPAFGEHGQLFVSLLILRQIFENITHVDIDYRHIFSKYCAKTKD